MDKMKSRLFVVFGFCVAVLSGCASVSPVVKTSSGNYKVIGYGSSIQQCRNAALSAATGQCRKTNKQVVVVSEDPRYNGLINAEINQAVKIASSVAKAAGETETSKTLGAASSGDNYEIAVNFICE